MLNSFFNTNFENSDVTAMLIGHKKFLEKNTGKTDDASKQHYVFNPEGILSNNRHFIAKSQMEAQPNGDATTEGQSLQILGYAYAYLATGLEEYRTAAKECFDAYLDNFYNAYGDNPIPESVQRYICNWIINGKEPVLANWPLGEDYPTHGGFQGEILTWTNGRTQIPTGDRLWGEYLDKFTFAFDGALGWKSIVATVYGLKDDGVTTDWDKMGTQYDVDWVVNYTGKKIDWDGNVLSENPSEPIGTVQLKNTGVNGEHKACWCNRQPVEHGGVMMERNKPWHNRPMNVPVVGTLNFGNASDAEQWFLDACYVMYRIAANEDPDRDKYYHLWKCAQVTVDEYSRIDSNDKFFRQQLGAESPYTDGISYDYTYPDGVGITYTRDSAGYIDCRVDKKAQHTLEQQSVWFNVNNDSRVLTTYSGSDDLNHALDASVKIKVATSRTAPESTWETWQTKLPYAPGFVPVATETRMGDFYQLVDAQGNDFIMADSRIVVDYGDAQALMQYETNVYDGRSAMVSHVNFLKDNAGIVIGFWLTSTDRIQPLSMVIKNNTSCRVTVTDANNWSWGWDVVNTNGSWIQAQFDWSKIALNSYQENEDPDGKPPGWTPPPRPNAWTGDRKVTQMNLSKKTNNTPLAYAAWYCVNTLPKTLNITGNPRVLMMYTLTVAGDNAFRFKLGDCGVNDAVDGGLFCTPGVIPFSNIYNADSSGGDQFDGWHGMPYPGYQHPMIWIENEGDQTGVKLNNMIEFLYQSQVWFTQRYGISGPGASAYIWNRWDNYKYGQPDTWTMYHWGDGHAWAGYQPRAYFSAARCWYEMVIRDMEVPPKLKTYVENWTKFLVKSMKANGGYSPNDFTTDGKVISDPNDFTGHMVGLWLAGACISALAGSKVDGAPFMIEQLVTELTNNYINTGIPNQVMNGSWSPGVRLETGNGPESNGMFFGFWSGEILRGLSMYTMYKRLNPGDNMYDLKEG